MGITKAHNGIHECKWLQAALVLLCLFFFGTGFFTRPIYCLPILFALMPIGLYLKLTDAFPACVACAFIILFRNIKTVNGLWPLPIAMALVLVFVAAKLFKFTGGGFCWIRRGDFGRRQIAVIALVAAVSGISLICWYGIAEPDISDLAHRIPHVHPGMLIVTGLVFALANAACEEFVWRGIIFNALERAFPPGAWALCIQALSFGAAHVHGFPRGASGIVLASIYGYIMGRVRQDAKGLLAPIAAHFFADAVIYSILASVVLAR